MLLDSFFRCSSSRFFLAPGDLIVNCTGGEAFTENTIFPPGVYKIECGAGYSYAPSGYLTGSPGIISVNRQEIKEPFIIRAFCGSNATKEGGPGINPYSGDFKQNASTNNDDIPPVSHIFGNRGSGLFYKVGYSSYSYPGGPNCLGNGAEFGDGSSAAATGAGSCIHFLPVNGIFGYNYLFAAHCCPGVIMNNHVPEDRYGPGGGSAYGGAGSASAYKSLNWTFSSKAGGSTPYGFGGQGVPVPETNGAVIGNSGQGIGAGAPGGSFTQGAACFFDGNNWMDGEGYGSLFGKIKVTYLGEIGV